MNKRFKISNIGLGTVPFGMDYGFSKRLGQDEVDAILDRARRAGINFLDTAREYGESEEAIGRYTRDHGAPFTIATKLSYVDTETASSAQRIRDWLESSIAQSKRSLGLSELPMLLLHQTDEFLLERGLFWDEIGRLKMMHPKLLFGLSVYDPEPTKAYIMRYTDRIDCIQAPYNVVDKRFLSLQGLLSASGIVFIARSAFLKGALVEPTVPPELRALEPVRQAIRKVAADMGATSTQVLINFVLSSPIVDCVLIGVRTVAQLEESLGWENFRPGYKAHATALEVLTASDPQLTDPRRWTSL